MSLAFTNGWPEAADAFAGADAIVSTWTAAIIIQRFRTERLAQLSEALKNGAGLGCCISRSKFRPDKAGKREFLNWIGSYFEGVLVGEPGLAGGLKQLRGKNPITRGVKASPFMTNGIITCALPMRA